MHVPALREHPEDIGELADAILRRLAGKLGEPTPVIEPEARAALQNYAFRGNVRELENILERALALASAQSIGVLDPQLRTPPVISPAAALAAAAMPGESAVPGTALGDQMEHIERDAIARALEQTRFNKTAAAKLLGMSFRALRYKVKKLGIE